MCLNGSQRDAAILALTKEVCVIQGPLGTGKTYVGLKVVETLLKNKEGFTCSPILIVCYTNHALDQFLEGITKFCPRKIVRIGGGCKKQSLKQFNLNKVIRKSETTASSSIQEEINQLSHELSALKIELQPIEVLQQFMIKGHYESLMKWSSPLSLWLNAPSGSPKKELPEQIHRVLRSLCLQWNYSLSSKVKLGQELNILERCAIYFEKVKNVREKIQVEMHFSKRNPRKMEERALQKLLMLTNSDILKDEIFDQYLGKSFTTEVRHICKLQKHTVQDIIKYWLLGEHRGPEGQLEDIEVIWQYFKEVGGVMATDNMRVKYKKDICQGSGNHNQVNLCYEPSIFTDYADRGVLYLIRKADNLNLDVLEETLSNRGARPITEESWQYATNTPVYSFAKVIRTLSSIKPMSDKEEENIQDIWKLETEQRYALYLLWLRRFEVQLKDQLEKTVDQLKIELREKQVALDEIIAKMLEHKRITIIGTTTTGAAKHKTLLDKVGCSVVIVEEAAEVLEAHVITALNVNCQHLILIGDHQQLRPKPATFELERNFGLTVSLFERLIRNNIPHVTLKIQHRMRPEVSQIIKLIYPGLEDHPSVNEFEHIQGVSKDVFFINHNHQETRSADNFSKSNMYEAQYAVALLRSNEEDIAGFVKIDNRVCVALSRAKKGFYILGNFDLFASKKPCKATLNCGHQCKGTCSDCLQGLVHQACNESCRHLPLPCGHPCQGYCSTPCPTLNIKSKMNTSLGPSYRGRPQRVGERRMGYIGMGRLNDWVRLRDRPEDLMPWMLSNVPELTDFLNSGSIDSRSMELFMICLQAVLQVSSFDQSFNKLLKTLAATDFYGVHLMKYFNQRNDSNMKENAETCLRYIIETSCRIPSSVSECLDILKYIVSNYSHLQCDINLLKEAIKKLRGANKTRAKKDQHLSRRWRDDDEPPENIRDISIFPTRQDLDKDFHPFLRENKTSGAYHHVGHYFDVIFRLMREDFIQPLRVGISKYRQQGAASAEMDMMFYENVKILGVNVFNGIEHILLLDREKLQTVRWDSERRLIFGSLICLSNDNFKTIIYATVSGMDRDELKKGMVRVVFQNCLEDVYGFSSEDSLTMTENPSFFEAYRHVLEGLQEMLGVTLPMEKYIVNCEKDIASPGHEENEPILVVCYTNHALDQFLEEMLPFCPDGIVRVGGKNDSEKLENFNMKELRRNHSRSLSTRNCIRDLHRRMDEIGKFIKELASKMQLLHLSISSEKTLQHFMLPKHFQEFSQFSGRSMRAWLNSSDVDLEKHVEIVVEEFLVKLFISENNA
ncbi:hypothetical protein Btru_011797 [Bulinus truncatus]|nr:hypothetical protein Btru_011797 [Bulinus truncatus]